MIHFEKESFEELEAFIYEEIKESIIREIQQIQRDRIQLDIDPVQVAIDVYCNTPQWPYPKMNGNL